jgi:hypothetical protein
MLKQEIRSLIRNSLPRIDKTARWHDQVINAAIEKVISQMYEDVWRLSPLNLQRYVKQYGYTTPVAVTLETDTNIYYSTLPESIIPFQDKASGVRRISTVVQGPFTFFPMDPREMDLVAVGCYFNTVNTKIGYAVNQTRIEYYNMSLAVAGDGVRMDLIIPFSKYDEDDEVKIPEMTDLKTGESFFDRVMKILGVVQPVDIKDDNAAREGGNQKDN